MEDVKMTITYKKLWKLLIDKDLKKTDLIKLANISKATMNKLSHNQNVTTEILLRICTALNCDIANIVEVVE